MIGGLESVKAGDEFPEADVVDGVDVIDVDEVIVVEAPFVVINGFGVWMDGAVPVAGLIVGAGTELAFGDVDPDSTCLSVMVVPVGIG